MTGNTIRHLLFDADEVLQEIPGGWDAAMEPFVGDRAQEFLREAWTEESPTLAGQGDYLPMLAAVLERYAVSVPAETVFADVWQRIEVNAESLSIVQEVRDAGFGVHLGTNQECYRGEFMKRNLGYDAIFDVHCYSYELGIAKPDPAFFVEAARRIGARPESILFIDDNPRNVEGATTAGLPAVRWQISDGHPVLRALLAEHGVLLGP